MTAGTARTPPVDMTDGMKPPESAVPLMDGMWGLAGLTAAWLFVVWQKPDHLTATWLLLLATAAPMLAREIGRAPSRAGTRDVKPGRWIVWPIGFVAATAPFLLVHGQGGSLSQWLVAWTVVAPAFLIRFVLEALRGTGLPNGGFPAALGYAIRQRKLKAFGQLAEPARLWCLKAFFIPLYGASLYALAGLALSFEPSGGLAWLAIAVIFAYTIDLSFGVSGYIFASNALVPTVRSTQTRLVGWVVCLLCYGPFFIHWPAFQSVVLEEIAWPQKLTTGAVGVPAALVMICLLALYISATVVFGLRFSNLSNRGVITTGPYRYMKHPAYFAHVGNAWIISLVLLPASGVHTGLAGALVPVAFTILYRLRAITEELHMRESADYRAYADWIAQHGIVARAKTVLASKTPSVGRK